MTSPLALSICLTSFYTASEKANADPDWLLGYDYRKQLNVTGSISGAQTNYTIRVTVHYGSGGDSGQDVYLDGKVSKDFQDVRFTKDDGLTLLECNRDEWYRGDRATFSIMVPSIPASPSNTTLFIYWDNPAASWRKYVGNPVVTYGDDESWENSSVRAMAIVWNGSHYVGFYQGAKHPPRELQYAIGTDLVTAIGMAVSPDGTTWTKYAGNPVLERNASNSWESILVGCPTVLYLDGTYHLWYSGWDGVGGWHYQVGYANSTDGITWVRYPHNPILAGTPGKFDASAIYTHGVIRDDDSTWKMVYSGQAVGIKAGYATAPTPWGPWTKQANGDPVITYERAWERDEINVESLVQVNGTYYASYSGGHGSIQMQVGVARSTDLLTWTKDTTDPVLENWAGTFDSEQLQDPKLVHMQDGTWRIYYSGASYGGDYGNFHIGYAETNRTDHPLMLSDADAGSWFATVADVDGNGRVDLADQRLVQLALFTAPEDLRWNPNADVDGDLDVDVGDMRIQQHHMVVLPETPRLFVDPPTYVASRLGETFAISINITDVQELWAFEFRLAYSPTLLDVLAIAPGSLLPPSVRVTTLVNETDGYLITQAYWFNAEAVNGNGTLATVTFNVTYAEPTSCILDLYNTVLFDYNADKIPHSAEDGTLRIEVSD